MDGFTPAEAQSIPLSFESSRCTAGGAIILLKRGGKTAVVQAKKRAAFAVALFCVDREFK
jgi:hypothetical protein